MKARIAAAALALLTQAGSAESQTPGVPPLSGLPAWAALTGNTIAGRTAEGPYFDYFAADGTAIHVDGDGREVGRWTLKGDAVCFAYPTDPDEQVECRKVEVDGPRGVFVNSDGIRYPFDVLPGDAKSLR